LGSFIWDYRGSAAFVAQVEQWFKTRDNGRVDKQENEPVGSKITRRKQRKIRRIT
jgi:hypothetical protein